MLARGVDVYRMLTSGLFPQDVADLLYILVSGSATIMLKQTLESVSEQKEAKESIAASRARPRAALHQEFLQAMARKPAARSRDGSGNRHNAETNGMQTTRSRWKSVGKAVAASSRLGRMMSTLKSAMDHNRIVGTISPGGHFGELSLQTVRAART